MTRLDEIEARLAATDRGIGAFSMLRPEFDALVKFAREVESLAGEWTFKGKGEPDDMPDEFQLTTDECAFALRKRLDALGGAS